MRHAQAKIAAKLENANTPIARYGRDIRNAIKKQPMIPYPGQYAHTDPVF